MALRFTLIALRSLMDAYEPDLSTGSVLIETIRQEATRVGMPDWIVQLLANVLTHHKPPTLPKPRLGPGEEA